MTTLFYLGFVGVLMMVLAALCCVGHYLSDKGLEDVIDDAPEQQETTHRSRYEARITKAVN